MGEPSPVGLSIDKAKYIMTLPIVDIRKDDVITDNLGQRWKAAPIETFELNGIVICKQAAVSEVD
jgi:hypothetical protein